MSREQRLIQKIQSLETSRNQLATKLDLLRGSLGRETRVEEKLRLTHLVDETAREIAGIERQLDELESQRPAQAQGQARDTVVQNPSRVPRPGDSSQVFISYSHDSPEHKDRVLELADRLRRDGIDCQLDQYLASPPEGWARWTLDRIEQAAFVLVVCTQEYEQRVRGRTAPGTGRGAKWEGAVITQELYEQEAHNTKFIPVLFSPGDSVYIPVFLRGYAHYALDTDEGYESLYRRLTDQHDTPAPGLGKRRTLPPRKRKVQPPNP